MKRALLYLLTIAAVLLALLWLFHSLGGGIHGAVASIAIVTMFAFLRFWLPKQDSF